VRSIFAAHRLRRGRERKTLQRSDSVGREKDGRTKGVREFRYRKSAIRLHFSLVLGMRKQEVFGCPEEGGSRKRVDRRVCRKVRVSGDSVAGIGREASDKRGSRVDGM
jgi:hypothetical protein